MSLASRFITHRLAWISLLVGAFVLLDVGLFGWLIFRSLSQREIERVLLETRQEAEGLAARIADQSGGDRDNLYSAVALTRETQTYIDSVLSKREIVQSIEVRDLAGKVVFRANTDAVYPLVDPEPILGSREIPPPIERRTTESESTYNVEVPIGEMGILRFGISRGELESRIGVLRRDLIGKTAWIGLLTVVLLLLAYSLVWWLWRRGRQLEEQAEVAERMAYIGTLASGLAHEIRNPLNALSLNMQMLEEEVGVGRSNGTSRRLFQITKGELGRLERLVTDFLSYAKPRPLDLTEVAAIDLLEDCRQVLEAELAERRAELIIEDASEGSSVRVDREQMQQLLLNLIQNGLAACEQGRRSVALRASRAGGRVVLEVADEGAGIQPQDLHRIFDLFYSTRRGGTGLGLAVVKRIAEAHGADLQVDSTPGAGTRVRLSLAAVGHPGALPLVEEEALAPTA